MSTYTETRYIGAERCPNGGTIHVTPVIITSGAPLTSLRTPGDITAAEPCTHCKGGPDA